MAQIDILIVVDTNTTAGGTTTLYMVSNDPENDKKQGSPNLIVEASPGDIIYWRTASVNQLDKVELTKFIDEDNQVFQSTPTKIAPGVWSGIVGNFSDGTTESYTFDFTINGSGDYSWDPEIRIKT